MLHKEVWNLTWCCGLGDFTVKASENGKAKITNNMADKKGRFAKPEEIEQIEDTSGESEMKVSLLCHWLVILRGILHF